MARNLRKKPQTQVDPRTANYREAMGMDLSASKKSASDLKKSGSGGVNWLSKAGRYLAQFKGAEFQTGATGKQRMVFRWEILKVLEGASDSHVAGNEVEFWNQKKLAGDAGYKYYSDTNIWHFAGLADTSPEVISSMDDEDLLDLFEATIEGAFDGLVYELKCEYKRQAVRDTDAPKEKNKYGKMMHPIVQDENGKDVYEDTTYLKTDYIERNVPIEDVLDETNDEYFCSLELDEEELSAIIQTEEDYFGEEED